MIAAAPVAAEDARAAAIRSVIGGQVEAFRRDDAAAAFAFASPMIQELFGTPANFMAMVQRGYPQVYRPQTFTFGRLEQVDGRLYQRVLVKGPDGALVTAVYEMVEVGGSWRINGCVLLSAKDEA
jgi:hypothetical protein